MISPSRGIDDNSTRTACHASERVRVLHVLPALRGGGMEHATLRLVKACENHRAAHLIDHALCVLRDADPDLLAASQASMPIRVLQPSDNGLTRRHRLLWWRLRQEVRSFRPHIVHARSTGAWLDAVLATMASRRVKLVLGYHGRETTQPVSGHQARKLRWAAMRGDAVLAVSRDAAARLAEDLDMPDGHVQVIPNGVDTARYHPPRDTGERQAARSLIGLSPIHQVVVCIANLMPVKGHDVLLRAWRQVSMANPHARLVLIGDGPLRAELQAQAEALRCREQVRFLGQREDTATLLRGAELFALASRSEGCCNAILEAMASGLPVVATEVGGTPEFVRSNRTGWLVPADAPGQLAETILIALNEHDARLRVGHAARKAAEQHFALDPWVQRYASYYHNVARGHKPVAVEPSGELVCAG